MAYQVLLSPAAKRDRKRLSPRVAAGLRKALLALAHDPRSTRFDVKPLQGTKKKIHRLRIADHRVLLRIDHRRRRIYVGRMGHRRHVYRGVEWMDEED